MKRIYELCNGKLIECNTKEELQKAIYYDFELRSKMIEEEKQRIKRIIEDIKIYVKEILSSQYPSYYEIGLVRTKLEEDIKNHKCFWIFIDRGNRGITHKPIYLKNKNIIY